MSPFGDGRLPRRQQFRGARCEPPVMAQPQQASGPPRLSSRCTRNRERPAAPRQKWLAGARCAPNVRGPNVRLILIPWFSIPGTMKPTSTSITPSAAPLPHVRRPTRSENAAAAYNHVPCPRRQPAGAARRHFGGHGRARRTSVMRWISFCVSSHPWFSRNCAQNVHTSVLPVSPCNTRRRGGQCRGLQGQLPGLGSAALWLRLRVGLSLSGMISDST